MSAANTSVPFQGDDLPMEHRAETGVIVSAIFTFVAIAIIVARFYTRVHIVNRVEANDIIVVIALVISTHANLEGYCVLTSTSFFRSSPCFSLGSSLLVHYA
jgi:hypothetical protein